MLGNYAVACLVSHVEASRILLTFFSKELKKNDQYKNIF